MSCTGESWLGSMISILVAAAGAPTAPVEMELTGHQESVDQPRWDPKNPDAGQRFHRQDGAHLDVDGQRAHAIETKGENINIHVADGSTLGWAIGRTTSLHHMRKLLKNIKFAVEVNEMGVGRLEQLPFPTASGTVRLLVRWRCCARRRRWRSIS